MGSETPIGPTPTRLRQVALVAKDLEKARHLLTKVIGTQVVYEDPLVATWGLKNFLVPIGGDIIEVVSPFQPKTTAGRLLDKRGDGGYMITMQTLDAMARKKFVEEKGLGKVIFVHEVEGGESVCVQYHPKGVAGGVIPELDSHKSTPSNPEPLISRFSPWHACGPLSTLGKYSAIMRKHGDLCLLGATLRLKPGDIDTQAAARQWEETFGVRRSGGSVQFTNATMKFIGAEEGKPEGLVDIEIGVQERRRLEEILWRAKFEGLAVDASGCVEMLGVKWNFILTDERQRSKL